MKSNTTYTCEFCGAESGDKKEMIIHEDRCERADTFKKVEAFRDARAGAYLDTIRMRATSISHLFKIILAEEDLIRDAVQQLHFKNARKLSRMYNFRWEHVHFTNLYNPWKKEFMSHSAPVGEDCCPMWSEGDISDKYSIASAVRIHFDQKGATKVFDKYKKYIGYIPGINTGSGGGVESVDIYLTLWKSDFPLMEYGNDVEL